MRPWLAAATLTLLAGCAQLVGADDPVPSNPVSPTIAGEYLLAIDLETATLSEVVQMRVPVTVDVDGRVLAIEPIALAADDRADLDDLGGFAGDIENDEELSFVIPWQIALPAAASGGGNAIAWIGNLIGHFPLIDGQPTTDGFCGTLDGTITAPTDAQIDELTTFGALRVEPGSLPTEAVSCADPRF
jgi:hypothetical protein